MKKTNVIIAIAVVMAVAAAVILTGALIKKTNADNSVKTKGAVSMTEPNAGTGSSLGSVVRFIDIDTPESLEDMASLADIIAVGRFDGLDSVWNMARDQDDPAKEEKELYTEGRLYGFTVENTVKGAAPAGRILVNFRYSEAMTHVDSEAVTDKAGEIIRDGTESRYVFQAKDGLFIEPDFENTYILFLKYDPISGYYYGAAEPFMIRFVNGTAELLSNLIGTDGELRQTVEVNEFKTIDVVTRVCPIEDNVSGLSMEEVLQRIANAD